MYRIDHTNIIWYLVSSVSRVLDTCAYRVSRLVPELAYKQYVVTYALYLYSVTIMIDVLFDVTCIRCERARVCRPVVVRNPFKSKLRR